MPVMRTPAPMRTQAGSFLLEALIAILIVALGVLGSVGLLARSMQEVDDARWRGEAAYLSNQLISEMWISNRLTANLQANYSSTPGTGPQYTEWMQRVVARLPNAGSYAQVVDVIPGPNAGNLASSRVTITLLWKPPGAKAADPPHQYFVHAIIGAN
jgi:type IV pilus assembly protein PilV